MDTVAMKG